MTHNLFNSLLDFSLESSAVGKFYSFPALQHGGIVNVARRPVPICVVNGE